MSKEKISISVPVEVINSVRDRAKEEHRNLSNMVSVLLADALEDKKKSA